MILPGSVMVRSPVLKARAGDFSFICTRPSKADRHPSGPIHRKRTNQAEYDSINADVAASARVVVNQSWG
jgi:hypothetical protein